MKTNFYLPILQTKQGEFDGLSKLSEQTKNMVVPLFEVTPQEWDYETNQKPKTIEEHLLNLCKKLKNKWPEREFFLDTNLVNNEHPFGLTSLEYLVNHLSKISISFIPVIRLNTNETVLQTVKHLHRKSFNEVGMRITIEDVTSPDFSDNIDKLLESLDIDARDCHLIFDLIAADFSNINDFSDGIMAVLENFPGLQRWKTFTICGGAFPQTSLIKPGINYVPRNDWKFFNELIKKLSDTNFKRKINYGDYSIVSPGYFEFDPRKMQRSANIRYTSDDFWYVIKGKALKNSEDFKQYIEQASGIVNSAFYMGSPFSDGDLHLNKCSKGQTKSGNPTVWKRVGHNHHITKVVSDLIANFHAVLGIE